MTDEMTGYKFSISFTQSVSSGIIAFHGTYESSHWDEAGQLLSMLKQQEKTFKEAGYKVATDIKPKEAKEKKDE